MIQLIDCQSPGHSRTQSPTPPPGYPGVTQMQADKIN